MKHCVTCAGRAQFESLIQSCGVTVNPSVYAAYFSEGAVLSRRSFTHCLTAVAEAVYHPEAGSTDATAAVVVCVRLNLTVVPCYRCTDVALSHILHEFILKNANPRAAKGAAEVGLRCVACRPLAH